MINEVNAIRALSIQMIEKANSGHPGICMGAAPTIFTLYNRVMNIDPSNMNYRNRDRFVLSAGHGSAMLYSTLHLAGYDLSISDLKEFRQVGSKTPGHPEFGHTDGVDSTSGPLGQGIAQAVGLAVAEKHLAAKYNKPGLDIYNNYTYVICGDGDLQEGVSAEASSFAGHNKLGKLIVLWDANEIQLDAPTNVAISEDILKRYDSYNWQTIEVKDGENIDEIEAAINTAKTDERPTMIKVNTVIGFGSPNKAGTPASHGAPLGKDEVVKTFENYGWTHGEFEVSEEIYENFRNPINERKEKVLAEYNNIISEYKEKYPEEYNELISEHNVVNFEYISEANEASRVSSGLSIQEVNSQIPNLIGGSADLSKSNNSTINDSGIFGFDSYADKNIAYGVREFAMAAITNGIVLYGGLHAFCSTFFVFSDYLKPALRMSALQNLNSMYVLTHDSVAVGEDGPTHEPIEQLTGLRAIPNVNVVRPCDRNEVSAAYKWAIASKGTPTVLVLTRQNLEVITDETVFEDFNKGAYIIYGDDEPEKVLIATGSEVKLTIDVAKKLQADGIKVRVISMPSMFLFDKQPVEYQKELFAGVCKCNRYYIEMARALEGYKYAGNVIGLNDFGLSGPASEVMQKLGYTAQDIYNSIK